MGVSVSESIDRRRAGELRLPHLEGNLRADRGLQLAYESIRYWIARFDTQIARRRERGIQEFKSLGAAQRFLSLHAAKCNAFDARQQ